MPLEHNTNVAEKDPCPNCSGARLVPATHDTDIRPNKPSLIIRKVPCLKCPSCDCTAQTNDMYQQTIRFCVAVARDIAGGTEIFPRTPFEGGEYVDYTELTFPPFSTELPQLLL